MRFQRSAVRGVVVLIATGAVLVPATGWSASSPAAPGAGTISTFAGTGSNGADSGDGGLATQANVPLPSGLAVDQSGDVYVLDDFGSRIREVSPDGVISTYAGGGSSTADGVPATSANLSASAIAVDHNGNLLIADEFHYKIRRINHLTGLITTVAGTGTQGESGDGGAATAATLDDISAITVDGQDNIYVGDDNRVRRIDAGTGVITTVAGNGTAGGSMGDGGPATAASVPFVWGLAVNSKGDLYISSGGCDCIRKVTHGTGIISIVVNANPLTDTRPVTPAQKADIQSPEQLAADSSDNIYITSGFTAFNEVARLDPADQTLTVVAGKGTPGYSGDGGPATAAELHLPQAVALTPAGDLVIADMDNNRVRIVYGIAAPTSAPAPTVTAITAPPITADTPLYKIPLVLSLTGGGCPSSVSVTLGSLPTQSEPVCGPGGHVPPTLNVFLRPWDEANPALALTPGAPVTATAGSAASVTVPVPARPVWVGMGDSYASGHNQTTSHWNFTKCGKVSNPEDKCGITWNDPGFAWETRAVRIINQAFAVPPSWQMTADIQGKSGASTTTYASIQDPGMRSDLQKSAGSWNVVSTTGGADDSFGKKHTFTFSKAVKDWYKKAILNVPPEFEKGIWTASAIDPISGCPDTEDVYQTARAARKTITTDIARALATAWKADRSVRLVDVNYPYVLPKSSSCAKGGGLNPNKHGTTAVINMLAAAHDAVPAAVQGFTAPGVKVSYIDLRDPASPFGSVRNPRKLLQLTAYYGYPHANAVGQEDIAAMAVRRLTNG